MIGLPPGNILQFLFIKERIKKLRIEQNTNSFIEVGSGNGHLSNLLLKLGMTGVGYDLNIGACDNNAERNKTFILEKNMRLRIKIFL